MSGQFGYAQPELEQQEVPLARLRRSQLFQVAISRGLLTTQHSTPTKDALIRIIDGAEQLPDSVIEAMQKPKAVPLNQAHREVQPTVEVAVSKDADDSEIADALVAEANQNLDSPETVDDGTDLFGEEEEEETPESLYEEFSGLKFFTLKSVLKDRYGVVLDRYATKADALIQLKVKLGLDEI